MNLFNEEISKLDNFSNLMKLSKTKSKEKKCPTRKKLIGQ